MAVTNDGEGDKRKITQFFKPVLREVNPSGNTEPPSKKRKVDKPDDPESAKIREHISNMKQELEVLDIGMGASWFSALEPEFSKPYFKKLSEFVTEERGKVAVFPSSEEVWAWTWGDEIKETRVVILGRLILATVCFLPLWNLLPSVNLKLLEINPFRRPGPVSHSWKCPRSLLFSPDGRATPRQLEEHLQGAGG